MVETSQRELSYILGEAVEKRSKETGSHVKRVANFSYLLGKLYGLSEELAEKIKLASPLHDVGKIGIPDKILNKPGKLDPQEWCIMQTHATLGYEILSQSSNELLQLGAVIAHQHHENWDGSGYPQGLAAEDIAISGRITALADVFDALASNRCYKKAWPLPDVLDTLKQEKGKKFEPKLVDLLLNNLDQFIEIRDRYPDPLSGDN
jgi:response regulator RpfG family c-di-GMP phosphodiesterase